MFPVQIAFNKFRLKHQIARLVQRCHSPLGQTWNPVSQKLWHTPAACPGVREGSFPSSLIVPKTTCACRWLAVPHLCNARVMRNRIGGTGKGPWHEKDHGTNHLLSMITSTKIFQKAIDIDFVALHMSGVLQGLDHLPQFVTTEA